MRGLSFNNTLRLFERHSVVYAVSKQMGCTRTRAEDVIRAAVQEVRALDFWDRVEKGEPGVCWEWKGARHNGGYGEFREDGRLQRAHRRAWELVHRRPIPAGKVICHTCDNPPCCNPRHLRLGTAAKNSAEKVRRGRSARLRGEQHGACKFSDEEVAQARELVAGGKSYSEVAAMTGISESYVSRLVRGARR